MRLSRAEAKQRTQKSLLDAAERLIAERGSAVSLEEITEAAGVTTGAVYSGFGGKRGLVAALFDRMNSDLLDRVESAISPDFDLRATLVSIAGCWDESDASQLLTELRTELQVMLWSLDDPALAAELQTSISRVDVRIRDILTGRQKASGGTTTNEEAALLLIHLRALQSHHATATAFQEPIPDLKVTAAGLAKLVE